MDGNTDLRHYLELKFQRPYTRERIIQLIAAGVLYLAKVTSLPNEEKKPQLLATIREIIMDSDLEDYKKDMLVDIVDAVGDSIIENLISFGKDMKTFVKRKCKWCGGS